MKGRISPRYLGLALCAVIPTVALATTVVQMNLDKMCDSSARIYRGEVLDVSESTKELGGGQIPVVTYTIRVDEAYKGDFEVVKDERVAELTMVGSIKLQRAGKPVIPGFPVLSIGKNYLIFEAPPGPSGLTATMGLGQGAFELNGDGAEMMALNGVNNVGLFKGMEVDAPQAGPIEFALLQECLHHEIGGEE